MTLIEIRSKKDLERIVQEVPNFRNPKVELEQYVTDASIVAELVWLSYMRREFQEGRVLDLGCGTGRFAIAASILGARQVVCLDIDVDAIRQLKELLEETELSNIDLVVADATRPPLRPMFDVTFQNPPFGIQMRREAERRGVKIDEGIDIKFLKAALSLSKIVYTIHKAPTTDFVLQKINEIGCTGQVIGYRVINIPPMYRHHFKRLHKVEVVLIRAHCPEEISLDHE